VTKLLRQHMISSFDLANHFNLREGLRVEEATLTLAGAAMAHKCLDEGSTETPAMKELLAYQIKRYIRHNLGLADLSPNQIAQHFGISRRQLYHVMEPVGGISRYQRDLRLQHCLRDIQNPNHAHLTLSEIAYRWGFKHPATFNRNFKAAFGRRPSEARAGAFVTESQFHCVGSQRLTKNTNSVNEHHQWFHAIGI